MSEQQLDDELKGKPVPFDFLIPLSQALEARIDYNFNSLIQLSLLIEYLYMQLEEKGIEVKLDEAFDEFQKQRIGEIREQFDQTVNAANENAEDLDLKDS